MLGKGTTDADAETFDDRNKVAKEVAEIEFAKLVDTMDLEVDPAHMDAEDRGEFDRHKATIVGAYRRLSLVNNEEGLAVFTPKFSESLPFMPANATSFTFRRPTGATLMAMDGKKVGADVTKLYASMAQMTGQHVKIFAAMDMVDLRICTALTTLFLA